MNSLFLAIACFSAYLAAYHTYGKFLGKKLFRLNPSTETPAHARRDNIDFIPARRDVLFGHHFTSIAGTGPIVGPAIGVIWGWGPALIWVVFGSIFFGAVHDLGSLVVSVRNQGRTIGDVAKDLVSPRVRLLFLVIIFFGLWIVIALFALIIAVLFKMYPQTVIPIWAEIPIALWLGWMLLRGGGNLKILSLFAVAVMYLTVILGAARPISLPDIMGLPAVTTWMLVLFAYAFTASVLPVNRLLQPRDYINSHQLFVALGLIVFGLAWSHPPVAAPVYVPEPDGAPGIFPFLFVVIACGAISGFHSLVSSGTSSKQLNRETDALFVGYGSMLLEGALSVVVIVACVAGLGMGITVEDGSMLTGIEAYSHHYASWSAASGLGAKLGAFVNGSANMISSYGMPRSIAVTIMGVFIVSFAATTLDTATRIQRYVISELALSVNLPSISGRYPATFLAVVSAMGLAFYSGDGKGAMSLWPLFGTVNQLMAALALLVITAYLARKGKPVVYVAVPMVAMVMITGWSMILNMQEFYLSENLPLLVISLAVFGLEVWMIIESYIALRVGAKRASS